MTNIGPASTAIANAVRGLVTQAAEAAKQFEKDPKLRRKMEETTAEMQTAMNDLVKHGQTLANSEFDKAAKKGLLNSARTIMAGTVRALRLEDKNQLAELIYAIDRYREELSRVSRVTSVNDVADLARAMVARVSPVRERTHQRIQYLADPILRRRLEEALGGLQAGMQDLVVALGQRLDNPGDSQASAKISSTVVALNAALDEIVAVAIESNKRMFEGIDFDHGMEPPVRPTLAELRACHEKILEHARLLEAAGKKRDAPDGAQALHHIGNAVRQEVDIGNAIANDCDDVPARQALTDACDVVETKPGDVIAAFKAVVTTSAGSAPAGLAAAVEALREASTAVLAAAARTANARTKMLELARSLHDNMAALEHAIATGNKRDIAKYLKAVIEDAQNAVAVARVVAEGCDDAFQRGVILKECAFIEDQAIPDLQDAGKALLEDVNNEAARARTRAAMRVLEDAVDRLTDACVLTPAQLLAKRTATLEDEFRALEDAVRRGDTAEAARRLKNIRDMIRENIAYGKSLLEQCDDPVRRKKLQDAVADLERLEAELVPVTKAALQGDPAALQRLGGIRDEAQDAIARLQKAAVPTDEELIRRAMRDVNAGLDELADALDRGDVATAKALRGRVARGLDGELALLERLAAAEDDPTRRQALQRARDELSALAVKFGRDADAAIANPRDRPARERLDQTSRQIKALHEELGASFPSPEDRMHALTAAIVRDLDALEESGLKGRQPEATEAFRRLGRNVLQASDLAEVLADQADREAKAKRIRDGAVALKGSTPPLYHALQDVFRKPRDAQAADELLERVEDCRLHALELERAATGGDRPEQRVLENAAHINALLTAVQADAEGGKAQSVARDNRQLARALPVQVDALREALRDSPSQLAQAERDGAALGNALKGVKEQSEKVARDPKDAAARTELARRVAEAKALNDRMLAAIADPAERLGAAARQLDGDIDRLIRAIERGDKEGMRAGGAAVKESAARELEALRAALAKETDPAKRAAMQDAVTKVERLQRELDPLLGKTIAGDKLAEQRLLELLRDAQGANAALQAALVEPTKDHMRRNAGDLHANLDALDRGITAHDRPGAEAALGDVQKGLALQMQLSDTARQAEPDARRRDALAAARSELEHCYNALPAATKDALARPKDAAAQQKAHDLVARAHRAVDASVAAVAPPPAVAAGAALASLHEHVVGARDGAARGDAAVTAAHGKGGQEALASLADALKGPNGSHAPAVSQALREAEGARQKWVAAGAQAAAAPRDAGKQAAQAQAAAEMERAAARAAQAAGALDGDVLDGDARVRDAVDTVAAAARRGGKQETADAAADADAALRAQVGAARALAALEGDAGRKAGLEGAADALNVARGRVGEAAKGAVLKGADDGSVARAGREAKERSAEVVAAAHTGGKKEMDEAGERARKALEASVQQLKAGKKDQARENLNEGEKQLRRQAALARGLAAGEKDERKKQLYNDASSQLESSLKGLHEPLHESLEASDKPRYESLVDQLLRDQAKAGATLQKGLEDIDRPPPPPPEEPKTELERAAQQIDDGLKNLTFDLSTPWGRLFAAAHRIAEELRKLSRATEEGDRQGAINASREIVKIATSIQKEAELVTKDCPDRFLNDQIISSALGIINCTQQLKVISAVKSATDEDAGGAMKSQLEGCGRKLAGFVLSCANSCEISTLKKKK